MFKDQSRLGDIAELVILIVFAINEFFKVSASVIVTMYTRAFENVFGAASDYVLVGKGVFLAFLLAMLMRWAMQIFGRIDRFRRPIKLKPSLVGIEIDSPLYQSWVTLSTAVKNTLLIWVACHVLFELVITL